MQIPNPAPSGTIWGPVSGISGVICAVFAALHWAGITPASLFSRRRSVVSQDRGVGKNVWVASALSASLFLSGYSFFSWIHPRHPITSWLGVSILGLLLIIGWSVLLRQPPKTKLVIYSANYRAWQAGGETYDVTEFLRNIVSGNSLVLDIENHNFVIGDRNFVPEDPLPFKPKRLRVTYSYKGEKTTTIHRNEHDRMVIPEDSETYRLSDEIEQLKNTQSTIPGNRNALQQSENLGTLPVYFQDLDIKLLWADTGTTLDLSKTTLFLKLSFTSDDDTGLRDMKVCFSVNGSNHVETPVDDLSDWILQAPFNKPQYPYKSVDEKSLDTVSLWRDIQHNGLKAGLVKTGWVGVRIPNARLLSEEVEKVKIEVTKAQSRRSYRFYFCFSDLPETNERVIDADFRRPS